MSVKHLLFRERSIAGAGYAGLFHVRSSSDGGLNGMKTWLPRNAFVFDGTLYVPAVPTAGQSYTSAIQLAGNGGVDLGSVVLTGDGVIQSVRGTYNADLPIGDASGSNAVESHLHTSLAGGAATQTTFFGFAYTCDAPDDDICLLGAGDDAFNWSLSGSDKFYSFGWAGVASVAAVAGAQIPIPVAGFLQYLYVRYILAAANTIELAIQLNGVDTAIKNLALPAAALGTAYRDYATLAAVAAGDLLSIRFKRTAGASTSFQAAITLGFRRTV